MNAVTLWLEKVTCIYCNGTYGMVNLKAYERNHETFYCPYCNKSMHYSSKSDLEKLQENNARLQREKEYQENEVVRQKNKNRALKGVITKVEKRIQAGVCLKCNRTFQNLRKHMECKHKEGRKEK